MEFKHEAVEVSRGGFLFCKWSVAVLLWAAFLLCIRELVVVAFLLLLFSAILSVRRAPLIKLFDWTVGRWVRTGTKVLDVYAMRFAHSLGTLFAGVCVLLLYTVPAAGRIVLLVFCVMKTVSASGYCPGEKIYNCMAGGRCCAFLSKS